MDAKVTRRIAIGVIFGGLIASPFVIRSLRKDRQHPIVSDSPYEKFTVFPKQVDSKLSPQELQAAFDSLFAERDMWLKFRGVSANIKIIEEDATANGNAESAKRICEGYMRLCLSNIRLDGKRKVFPFTSEFTFSKKKDSEPLTVFMLDRNNNKRETKGERVEGLEPDFITQLLGSPLEVFAAFPNNTLQDVMTSLWKVTKPSVSTFAFIPNEHSSDDGFRAPELELANGHLRKFVSKRKKDMPFTVTTLSSPVESNGFFFPGNIQFVLDPNGSKSQQKFQLSVFLSDVDVIVG